MDLSAYSVPERLALFTQRVAPVTIAWFNAFATSGCRASTTSWARAVVYPGEEPFFTEHILRLP